MVREDMVEVAWWRGLSARNTTTALVLRVAFTSKGREGLEASSLEEEARVPRASVSARTVPEAPRLAPRRATLVHGSGRIAAAILPAASIVVATAAASWPNRLATVVVYSVIWSVAL